MHSPQRKLHMNEQGRIHQKNPDIVARKIADEIILVPILRKVGDVESSYNLNQVAAPASGS